MNAEFSLDQQRRERAPDLRQAMRQAWTAHGVAYLDQMREMALLGLSRTSLEPAEYYQYGLCDHQRYDRLARRSFLGNAGAGAYAHLSASPLTARGFGKLGFEKLMRAHGLPATRTLARYGGSGLPDGVRHLPDSLALGRFLREAAERCLFGKPAGRCGGKGLLAVDGWEPATDRLSLSDGEAVGVLRLQRLLEPYAGDGYLLQSRLLPHPELAPLGRVSTARVLVLETPSGPILHRVSWKIPGGRNVDDGFWSVGNLLAAVDPESGRVWRIVDDLCPRQREVELHPDNKLLLRHRTLPDWTTLRATVLAAAELFPDSPLLTFDVALADEGPVLIGGEAGIGDPFILQLAQDRGLVDPWLDSLLDTGRLARRAA